MLGIKNPSQLYKEAHAGSYAMIRLKGDKTVNHALDSRLERESTWKRKSSSTVDADKIFQENVESKKISIPTTETVAEKNSSYKQIQERGQ